ncbi:hypothetical protein [Succinivibrio faecicola]|uniref:Uncharacterized protein n=1 Tax=Succinivibrio faecicola TaxID=2820300 RepID=A0ABS7DE17_9GAMM|nr:hypothetical protein [Succinivibrio faecicola]MBW7569357.1 hypothetical protein [Succinivibrio faecicola]
MHQLKQFIRHVKLNLRYTYDRLQFLSVYYEDQKYHKVFEVSKSSTALLIIDLQNTYTKLGKTKDTKRFSNFSKDLKMSLFQIPKSFFLSLEKERCR